MRVEIEGQAPGVEPGAAIAWWIDVREGHEDHAFVPGARRRVLEADEHGFEVVDRVRWLGVPVFHEHTLARVRGNTVQVRGSNTFASFEARYRFEHAFEPEGTRVTLEASVELRGPLSVLERPARPIVGRILDWDTRRHLEQMVEGIGEAGPEADARVEALEPRAPG